MQKITLQELKAIWSDVVLLIEKDDNVKEVSAAKRNNKIYLLTGIVACISYLYITAGLLPAVFGVIIFLGVFLSVEAIKTEMGFQSSLSKQFCSIMENADCSQVINSQKNIINLKFSDLSIYFFSSQLLGILLLSFRAPEYFSMMNMLLYCSVPLTLYSIFFQWKVEKKWCPICLSIIAVLYLEILFLTVYNLYYSKLSYEGLQISDFIIIIISAVISVCGYRIIKKTLTKLKSTEKENITNSRYVKNYSFFESILKNSTVNTFSTKGIFLGNPESNVVITAITSPFCSFCKEAHSILHSIYDSHSNDIGINIRFNFSGRPDASTKEFFIQLYHIYITKGDKAFLDALSSWYHEKNINKWLEKYSVKVNDPETVFRDLLKISDENFEKGLFFTPNFYINQYQYPDNLERKYLESFVPDLIESNNL
ncbi:vitamin K epoxide reductase family protein [Chryseobacterium shigense]|uniref:Vitamin K epoxide reductase domain-containing protein n=1 Tax=Chryseobacterium shigense TaxID=297244 RepID=A0A841NHM3_9FLAO|nr:vitamin K epoxide reductase family protein [Chryseobacterium shigense]MBB6371522.1 hypothetical protein [Chryseobacterium shigense]